MGEGYARLTMKLDERVCDQARLARDARDCGFLRTLSADRQSFRRGKPAREIDTYSYSRFGKDLFDARAR